MKRFLYNTVIFTLPLVCAALIFEILLRGIPNDYSYKKSYLDSNSNSLEVLYLGSSHALFGIDPSRSRFKGFNAAYYSQDLRYDYLLLQKYVGRLKNLRFIVVPLSYLSLYDSLEAGEEAWRAKNYQIYYQINTPGPLPGFFPLAISGTDQVQNIKQCVSYYLLRRGQLTCSNLGWCTKPVSKTENELIESGREAVKRHSGGGPERFSANLKLVELITEFARSNKSKVLIYSPPAYHTYSDLLTPDRLDSVSEAARKLCRRYDNLAYADFLWDSSFTREDFYDADHLNSKGAKLLTEKIDSILNGHRTNELRYCGGTCFFGR